MHPLTKGKNKKKIHKNERMNLYRNVYNIDRIGLYTQRPCMHTQRPYIRSNFVSAIHYNEVPDYLKENVPSVK